MIPLLYFLNPLSIFFPPCFVLMFFPMNTPAALCMRSNPPDFLLRFVVFMLHPGWTLRRFGNEGGGIHTVG